MYIFKTIRDLKTYLSDKTAIGFVPTMGALHQGHISLMRQCMKESKTSVCSIFVNPTQFNSKEDYEQYPITLKDDILLLEQSGCEVLFIPSVEEIYPDGIKQINSLDLGNIAMDLEGKMRPGHYDGVAAVVARLIDIVVPDKMYMGLKDFQQILVVKKMAALKSLRVEIVPCETIREESGLAMSSRNRRLSESARERAIEISKVLFAIRDGLKNKSIHQLINEGGQQLSKVAEKVEYLEVRDAANLEVPSETTTVRVVLVAAWIDGVRLIDNILLPK
jgi:pantoate--beta-alanine ligase